jgi:tRNA G18 (ribose-2'-O)-methylase SpoU
MRSNVNLSTIIRTAGCCGVTEVIATGNAKVDPRIARDGAEQVQLTVKRTLAPVLKRLKSLRYTLVGLEQATGSVNLHDYAFPRKCVLVIGAEREGISQECLDLIDTVVEIPVWGLPFSYNVATATSLCLYEYCRQYPTG